MLFLISLRADPSQATRSQRCRDWNQGYLMAQFENQTGVQMEADTLQLHWKDGKHPWKNAAIMKKP